MGRKVISCNAVVKLIEPFAIPDVQQWVSEKCRTDGYEWLLIHSLEGTLWGRFEQGELKLALPTDASPSDDPVASLLLQENIIQLRLFCADKELFLWRTSDGKLRGRVIEDTEDLKNNRWNLCLDETQLL
ncbi:MAG: hypothetical protein K2Z81_06965, partial [Cyanobacteria bacterium]|nr:hypothetical protein [Cyanobacteriota bacterium]